MWTTGLLCGHRSTWQAGNTPCSATYPTEPSGKHSACLIPCLIPQHNSKCGKDSIFFSSPSATHSIAPLERLEKTAHPLHVGEISHSPQEAEPPSTLSSQIQLLSPTALSLAQHRPQRCQLLLDGISSSAKSSLKVENSEKVQVRLGINPIPDFPEMLKTMTRNPPTFQSTQTLTLRRRFQQL